MKTSYRGAPVNPAPYTVTQPDGSTIRVHNFGDHLSSAVATVKGNYTVVKGSDGVWRYAAGLTASGKLKPSNVVAGQGAAPQAAQDLAPAPSAKTTPNKTPLGGTGDDKELVILVQFANQSSLGSTEAQWANHYFGPTGSVDNFYDEASTGQFGLAPAAENCGSANNGVTNWLTLPYNHPNTGVNNAATEQYIADAITLASGCVDFASFDTNHDGDLNTDELHVTIIGAGDETSYSGPGNTCNGAPSIWGHEWNLDSAGIAAPVVDGVTVAKEGYTTFGEWHCAASQGVAFGHKATIGIMAHEFGHDINWPDLYDTDQSGEGVGEWSLMGSGSWGENTAPGHEPGNSPSYPDAYSLYYQGWIMPTVATVANDIPIAAHQSLLLGPNPGGTDWLFNETEGNGEFFLLENRTQQGYDQSTPGCGIVVYRIDETVTPSNAANADENDPLVAVIQADGLKDLENGVNRGDVNDPFPTPAGTKHDLDNATTPNTKFHDGTASNLDIHVDESACASTMHVDVTHLGDPSPAVVRPSNDMFVNAIAVTGASGSTTGNSVHATTEPGEPKPAGVGRASIWYKWTAPASGNTTITMAGSDYDTVLGIYTGNAVNALTELASNDDENNPGGIYTSKVVLHVTAGTTYRIAADGYGGDSGAVHLAWNLVADPPTAKLATTTTASAPKKVKYKKDFDVTANVAPAGATGTVTVMEGSKVLGTGTLVNGTVKIRVKKNLKPGRHTLTVSYGGSSTHLASSTTVKVKVKKKRRHH